VNKPRDLSPDLIEDIPVSIFEEANKNLEARELFQHRKELMANYKP